MSDSEKLDLILKKLEENNKLLNKIIDDSNSGESMAKEYLLNVLGDMTGNILFPGGK